MVQSLLHLLPLLQFFCLSQYINLQNWFVVDINRPSNQWQCPASSNRAPRDIRCKIHPPRTEKNSYTKERKFVMSFARFYLSLLDPSHNMRTWSILISNLSSLLRQQQRSPLPNRIIIILQSPKGEYHKQTHTNQPQVRSEGTPQRHVTFSIWPWSSTIRLARPPLHATTIGNSQSLPGEEQ